MKTSTPRSARVDMSNMANRQASEKRKIGFLTLETEPTGCLRVSVKTRKTSVPANRENTTPRFRFGIRSEITSTGRSTKARKPTIHMRCAGFRKSKAKKMMIEKITENTTMLNVTPSDHSRLAIISHVAAAMYKISLCLGTVIRHHSVSRVKQCPRKPYFRKAHIQTLHAAPSGVSSTSGVMMAHPALRARKSRYLFAFCRSYWSYTSMDERGTYSSERNSSLK